MCRNISGMASLDRKSFGKIGMRAIGYYGFTSFVAVFTGIFVVVLIKPGQSTSTKVVTVGKVQTLLPVDTILDLIRCPLKIKCLLSPASLFILN